MIRALIEAPSRGHVVEWLPQVVADGWRAVLWLLMIAAIGRLLTDSRTPGTSWVSLGRWALMVFIVRSAVTQAQNWHAPITYEGLPVTTLAVLLVLLSSVRFREPSP